MVYMKDQIVNLNLEILIFNWSEQIGYVNYVTMNVLPFFWEGCIFVNDVNFAFL